MKHLFLRLTAIVFFVTLFSCENKDKVVVEEPIQPAATQDSLK